MQVEQKNSINSIGNRSWIWSRERCLGNSACFPRSAQVLKTCSIAFVLLPGVMNVLTHTRTHTTHTLAYTRKCLDTLMLLSVALDNGSLCLCLCLSSAPLDLLVIYGICVMSLSTVMRHQQLPARPVRLIVSLSVYWCAAWQRGRGKANQRASGNGKRKSVP